MIDLRSAPHVVAVLRELAGSVPDREAVVHVTDPDRADGSQARSYGWCDDRARRIAARLLRRFRPGDRVLLLYPSGVEFVAAFLGCLYAGMVAVLAPLPGRYRHQRDRVAGIADDAGASVVLTDRAGLGEVTDWLGGRLPCIPTDAANPGSAADPVRAADPGTGGADGWAMPMVDRETLAVLQYTSGSTAEPKGVMLTHGNLLHNIDCSYRAFGSIVGMRTGGWIPLFHDMGLMGQLLPAVLTGGTFVFLDPAAFLRRPVTWVRLLDRFGVHITAGPNFGYELCVRRVSDEQVAGLDLSRLRVAINASEPVHAGTVDAFVTRFARAGLDRRAMTPCFGLAEATLFVSGTAGRGAVVQPVDAAALERGDFVPAGAGERSRAVVSCGRPQGVHLRIVDPVTLDALPPGRIGEIVLRGPGIAKGYWRRERATADTFGVTVDGTGGFLRTGDLGAVYKGELYVTGRLKETLVIRGRKLHPHDIEHELRARHAELDGRAGAVFTAPGSGGEALVVVHEIPGRLDGDQLQVLGAAMRLTVTREFGVRPESIVLLRPGGVSRTTSGKIQRAAMRRRFLAGTLDPVHAC